MDDDTDSSSLPQTPEVVSPQAPTPDDNFEEFLFDSTPEPVSTIAFGAKFSETAKDDLIHLNNSLSYLAAAFPKCHNPLDVCRLALTTGKLLETRRKLLLLQYGAADDATGGKGKRDEPRRPYGPLDS